MLLIRVFLVALLGTGLSFAKAEHRLPIVVIESGGNFTPGSFPRSRAWLGLFCDKQACEIRKTKVTIKSTKSKNVVDELEPTENIHVNASPIALIHGVALKPGKIPAEYRSTEDFSSHYSKLKKQGAWPIRWGAQPLVLSWVKLPEDRGYRYHVTNGKIKQFLFQTANEGHYGGDTTPIIHWVGDLNGDGLADILLSLPDDNCGFDERLYLTTKASAKEIWYMAAQHSGGYAACGC